MNPAFLRKKRQAEEISACHLTYDSLNVIERRNCGAVLNLGSLAPVMPRNCDIFAHSLPIMLFDPALDCRIKRRASMLALQFPEGRLGQMRDVWKPALSDTRIRFDIK